MITAIFFVGAMAATGALCWLSAWSDDHKAKARIAATPRPMPRRELPNAYYRALQ